MQAGSSDDGKQFAAAYAEAIFTAHQTIERAQDFYADIKDRARRIGRDPEGIKVLPGIVPVIGSTEAEAQLLAQQLDDLRVPEYGLLQLSTILEVPAGRAGARRAAAAVGRSTGRRSRASRAGPT